MRRLASRTFSSPLISLGYSRKNSLAESVDLKSASPVDAEASGEEDEDSQMHPVQSGVCTTDNLSRLCMACVRQLEGIPYFKKKRVSGLREVEETLSKLRQKVHTEQKTLQKFESAKEINLSISFLQDTLILISRKLNSVAKRKFFLDSAYSKRILVLHQSLNSAVNDLFLSLSRQIVTASLSRRQQSVSVLDGIRLIKDSEAFSPKSDTKSVSALDRKYSIESKLDQSDASLASAEEFYEGSDLELNESTREPAPMPISLDPGLMSPKSMPSPSPRSISSDFPRSVGSPRSPLSRRSTSPTANPVGNFSPSPPGSPTSRSSIMSPSTSHRPTSPASPTSPLQKRQLSPVSPIGSQNFTFSNENNETKKEESHNSAKAAALCDKGRLCLSSTLSHHAGDDRKAVVYFAKAAQMGYAPAMVELGRMYETGTGCEQPDLKLARNFYQTACNHKYPPGIRSLALFDIANSGDIKNPKRREMAIATALDHLTHATRLGDSEAMCTLAEYYLDGSLTLNLPPNREKAMALLAAAVKAGHSRAQNNLGVLLLQDPKSRASGVKLLEISAGKGCAKAQNNLGMYHEGIVFYPEDEELDYPFVTNSALAFEYYKKAAAQGLPLAMHNLAYAMLNRLELDQRNGIPIKKRRETIEKMLSLFTQAEAQGIAESNYYLGLIYQSGELLGGKKNEEVALFHFKQLLEMDKSSKLAPKAAFLLGNIFYHRKRTQDAAQLYDFSSRRGCAEASNALGLLYENGFCSFGEPNYDLAFKHYELAHDGGNLDGTVNLALLYSMGLGIAKDSTKSKRLLQTAAEAGHRMAHDIIRSRGI